MNDSITSTNAWTSFTIAAFIIAATMMAGGIYFLEASFAAKGFYSMATIMLVHTTVTITKTLRDNEEARKEEARRGEMLAHQMVNGRQKAA